MLGAEQGVQNETGCFSHSLKGTKKRPIHSHYFGLYKLWFVR